MAFKLIKRNRLRVPVQGTINDDDGKPVKFDFTLVCHRLNQAEIDAELADKKRETDAFLERVITGWESVLHEDGSPIDFNADNLHQCLLQQAGMRAVCFGAYLSAVGAVAKN